MWAVLKYLRMPCASVPAASVSAGLFFEVACRTSPLVLAVVSAGACDRLATDRLAVGLRSSCAWLALALQSARNRLSESDAVPESEANPVADSKPVAAGISTGISAGSSSSCISTTDSLKASVRSKTTM